MRKFILESHLALLLAILGICIVSLFIITACHKMDQKDDLVVAESTAYQKFFTVPVSTNLVVKAIIQSIKHQDEQAMFIEELAKKAGYAIWDRAFVTSEISAINSRLNGEGTNLGELVYIPFVKENEEYTNAILIVKILGVDTSYRLFYGSSYASLGFGTVQRGSWNATDLFHTFMTFDNAMFGYNGFIVKDKRLIPSLYLSGDTTGETRIQLQGTDQNFKLVAGISCHPIEVCGECLAFKTQSSSQLYRCCNPTIQNYCTTYWYDDGSGNISSPIGGGSTGGWQNPCRPIPGISDPCSGNGGNNGPPGWVPVEEENVPFGAENFDTWGVSSEDQVKINSWRANNIDTSGLDSCRREILRKLIGRLGTSPIGILLTKLDNAIGRPNTIDKFYVHFLTRPLANDNAFTEHATYDDINHEFEIDIVLDSTTAKTATELFIANALIHELVHAYMV